MSELVSRSSSQPTAPQVVVVNTAPPEPRGVGKLLAAALLVALGVAPE